MHTIEPYYRWRKYYIASEDEKSPFYGRIYSEFEFTNKIYNYLIHPQWDEFGSETLYLKILYANYNLGFAIIEFIGEWNDTLYNDIMYLKREVIDRLVSNNINKYILIGENVLNFHSSDDSYYEEWFSDIEDGWIVAINFQEHVVREFLQENIGYYITFNYEYNTINWRSLTPLALYKLINDSMHKQIE
ncbi:MAG: hypothetical protein KQH79_08630 [Bacteroidetes bacterium]|nr:hypothetical protein [Bacteroidota bacterium]